MNKIDIKRKLVVGDIHGDLWALIHLMAKVHFNPREDQLVFLGDYCDRGPHSAQVISKIREYQRMGAIILAGNHDEMFAKAIINKRMNDVESWYANDYLPTLESYKSFDTQFMEKHCKWLLTLPKYFEDDEYFYSHAPYNHSFPHKDIFKTTNSVTWAYPGQEQEHRYAKKPEGLHGICGHVHNGLPHPRFYPHYTFVDSGCGCWPDAPLTCVDLTNKIYYQSNGLIQEFQVGEF